MRMARVLPTPGDIRTDKPKPTWVDALEQSLLLAIILFSLITWMCLLAVFAH
jgi:hypothetical protein